MTDKVIIEIQKAGNNIQVLPMSQGSPMYKIVSDGKVIAENLSRDSAETMIKSAKDRVILG